MLFMWLNEDEWHQFRESSSLLKFWNLTIKMKLNPVFYDIKLDFCIICSANTPNRCYLTLHKLYNHPEHTSYSRHLDAKP